MASEMAVSLDQVLEYGVLPAVAVLLLVQQPLVLILARPRLLEELGDRQRTKAHELPALAARRRLVLGVGRFLRALRDLRHPLSLGDGRCRATLIGLIPSCI